MRDGNLASELREFVHPEDEGHLEPPDWPDGEPIYDWEEEEGAAPCRVAFVASRFAPVHEARSLAWAELERLFRTPAVGEKDGPGWVPVDIDPGPRKAERVRSVSALVLDIEAKCEGHGAAKRVIGPEPPNFEVVREELARRRWRTLLHTSFSHTAEHHRYRLVLAVSRPLAPAEVRPLGEYVALRLGVHHACDLACLEPARLFYLPRQSDEGREFLFASIDGAALDVDALLAATARLASSNRRAGSAESSGSVIAEFNRRYSPADIIERNGYKRVGTRWLFAGSSSGLPGVVMLHESDPPRIFSHHSGDPLANGHACDAFECFALLEHAGDHPAAVRAGADVLGLATPQRIADRSEAFDPETGEVLDNPPSRSWPQPVDLWAQYDAPAMPIDLLPQTIADFAVKHGEVMGVDPAGLAMAALTVCAAALTDEIAVQVKRHDAGWRESPRLWVGLVGNPSMKKSPILNAALRPLRRSDANLMQRYLGELSRYEALAAKEKKSAPRPRQERRIISDATVEAAQEVLKDSPRGVLSSQDELSGWFGAMDKYAPGKGSMADRGFWLQAFNGGAYSISRVVRGSSFIPNCSVCLLGGIQPEPLRAIANDVHDDGLIQRFLPVILRPGAVGRDVPADGAVAAYERLVEHLELMRPLSGGAADDRVQPLRFDDRVRTLRAALEAKHLELSRALEGVSPKLAAHFGKYDGLFARLCVLWHCIEHADSLHPPPEIGLPVAQRVADFMERFLRPMAVAFYAGTLGLSAGHDDLLAVASFIVAKEAGEVRARDVQSSGQTFRHWTADQVRVLCEKLEAFGWLERTEPAPKSNTPRWLVNPRVHELFRERAAAEVRRRDAAREALREAVSG